MHNGQIRITINAAEPNVSYSTHFSACRFLVPSLAKWYLLRQHSFSRGSTNGCSQNCLRTPLDRHTTNQSCLTRLGVGATFVLSGISGELKPLIIKNYTILHKSNIPTRQRTNLETQQILFFVITTRREEDEPFIKSLSTDLCSVNLRLSSLGTTQHNR